MTAGGAARKTPPTGWVLVGHRSGGFTIRWRRGDHRASVLRGNQVGSWTTDGLLATIPVPLNGWTDLAEIRMIGEKWARSR